ncbi:MAG: NCS2 family permease [bacterium]|jgi:AGZA family xanthine/uracil permease-like MFS transporter
MRKFFNFELHGTDYHKEIIGGVTTFFAMAYIIIVNPAILSAGGIPREASLTATILASIIGTLVMAFYARRPFAVAPYMGENAFIAYTICLGMGYPWQKAVAAVFISGVIFILITALRIRSWITTAIPNSLKRSFAAGIGFFIIFIGLNDTGLIRLGIPGAPVKIGIISSAGSLLAIFCIILIAILMIRKVPGAILFGILLTTILAFIFKHTAVPDKIVSMPPSLSPILFQLDIAGVFNIDFLPVILVLFIMAFVDTMGTLIGVSARAGLLDEHGNLPEIEKPMMADAIATASAGLLGTSTSGAFIESAAGIEAGARSGFASVVTAIMFALSAFLAPLFVAVPGAAYGAALVIVGFLMLAPMREMVFTDYTELFPAAATIAMIAFTYNIGFGIASGFILYPLLKVVSGRARELTSGVWVLFFISLLLFIFYPYGKL